MTRPPARTCTSLGPNGQSAPVSRYGPSLPGPLPIVWGLHTPAGPPYTHTQWPECSLLLASQERYLCCGGACLAGSALAQRRLADASLAGRGPYTEKPAGAHHGLSGYLHRSTCAMQAPCTFLASAAGARCLIDWLAG
eukprot:scaffold339_cov402-Prasinococcus_capsulatus_cf.AAC.6